MYILFLNVALQYIIIKLIATFVYCVDILSYNYAYTLGIYRYFGNC